MLICGEEVSEKNYLSWKYITFKNCGSLARNTQYLRLFNLEQRISRNETQFVTGYRWMEELEIVEGYHFKSYTSDKRPLWKFLQEVDESQFKGIELVDISGKNFAEFELFD